MFKKEQKKAILPFLLLKYFLNDEDVKENDGFS
jgi:hypothetical protein